MGTTSLVLLLVAVVACAVAAALALRLRAVTRSAARRERTLRDELAEALATTRTEEQTLQAFRSLAGEALQEQSQRLLELADARHQVLERSAEAKWTTQGEIVVRKLDEYSRRLGELEKGRQIDAGSLREAVESLGRQTRQVQAEAASLASALRDNRVRGVWGEMQLRRVLESSGMLAHVDFVEQRGYTTSERQGRPDVVVRLPNGRCVVIDAKAPLGDFLRAAEEQEPDRRTEHMAAHARAVAAHVGTLSKRRYADLVDGAVDFVVLFVPGDAFLTTAMEARPELLEEAFGKDVILASPSTLLAFLRGVAVGWRERMVAEQAEEIARVGRELHERVAVFAEHFTAVGGSLDRAVGAYNRALGSMESRLLVSARRLDDLGAGSAQTLPQSGIVDEVTRRPTAAELRPPHEAA